MQTRNKANSPGIDVSKWQGEIDWQAVRRDVIRFAQIKATEGTSLVDARLVQNAEGARDAGIPIGFYHFAHLSNDPVHEAEHYLAQVKRWVPELWHVLDLEQGSLDGRPFTKAQVSAWARAWLENVQAATGQVPMLYTGASFAKTYMEPDLAVYPLWVAHYGTDKPMGNPVWSEWTLFQYSETGRVDGINGHVDLNEYAGNIEDRLQRGKRGEEKQVNFSDDWQWETLTKALHGLYEKSVTGELDHPLVTDYKWATQANNKEMKLDDLAWLAIVLIAKDKGIKV
ncbi:glycoside hydrolase family 25 protein [Paenibacillus hodogayensis]|uniref:Glycoside hydrolase family 25 protein n=1 Tax=Paenibacillus hodogayensis TaxID=279208 RepID=A0ABV5W105_9BACL